MAKEKEARRPFNLKKEVKLLPGYIILLLWVIFTIALLGWVFGASFSTTAEIFQGKALKFESGLHFENYAKAWNGAGVAGFFGNSLIYSVISCTILILVCAPAAYVLSRFDFIANKFIQTSFVSAMGVPAIMVVLPLFSIISGMGILNNVAAGRTVLIILYVGINVPYTTIFLLTFFSNISRTYEEAAAIDGCPPMRTFWKIMFPMAQSGIVTVTIFNFINIWNEYFLPFVVDELLGEKKATVKVLKSMDKWYGVTYKEDKPVAVSYTHLDVYKRQDHGCQYRYYDHFLDLKSDRDPE